MDGRRCWLLIRWCARRPPSVKAPRRRGGSDAGSSAGAARRLLLRCKRTDCRRQRPATSCAGTPGWICRWRLVSGSLCRWRLVWKVGLLLSTPGFSRQRHGPWVRRRRAADHMLRRDPGLWLWLVLRRLPRCRGDVDRAGWPDVGQSAVHGRRCRCRCPRLVHGIGCRAYQPTQGVERRCLCCCSGRSRRSRRDLRLCDGHLRSLCLRPSLHCRLFFLLLALLLHLAEKAAQGSAHGLRG